MMRGVLFALALVVPWAAAAQQNQELRNGIPIFQSAPPAVPASGGTYTGAVTFAGGIQITNAPTHATQSGLVIGSSSSYAYPGGSDDYRPRFYSDTATITGTLTGTLEPNFFQTVLTGTGTATGETVGVHHFLTIGAGVTRSGGAAADENFEGSGDNFGVANVITNFLGIFHNQSTGTIVDLATIRGGYTNDNTTPGSIAQYAFMNFNGAAGAGTVPTTAYLIRNNSTFSISTLGGVSIGSLAVAPNQLYVQGADTSGSTFPEMIRNSSLQIVRSQANDGTAFFKGDVTASTFRTSNYLQTNSIRVLGGNTGTITLAAQGNAGTYEWDWPITVGTAGQFLTSQGGAGSAMTWTSGVSCSVGTISPLTAIAVNGLLTHC